MKRGIITISESGNVNIPDIPVWMTLQEIADLFGVFSIDIRRMTRIIHKEGILSESETMRCINAGKHVSMDIYSLEFVIAVSFRTGSERSSLFREYLIKRLYTTSKASCCFLIPFQLRDWDKDN